MIHFHEDLCTYEQLVSSPGRIEPPAFACVTDYRQCCPEGRTRPGRQVWATEALYGRYRVAY